MLIELSKIVNAPVGALDRGEKVGTVKRVIVSPDQGKLIAVLIATSGFPKQAKVISFIDIIEIDRGGVVISSSEQLLDQDEIVRVDELIKKKFNILRLKAVNREEKFLGFISDVIVDSQSGGIMRVYVDFLWRNFVFTKEDIVRIELNKAVFDNGPEEVEEEEGIKIAETAAS